MVFSLADLDLPIIQAPMAGVQDSALAIAVSSAGGLGSLPCGMLSLAALKGQLEAIKTSSTNPVNLNFFCHQPPTVNDDIEAQWRQLLQPYFAEYGIDGQSIKAGQGREPFNHAVADIVEPYRPAVVSFHYGLPDADLLARVKSWGATVLSSATTVAEALWLEANGADVIIAQGLEAGGHRGMFLSNDLTTQVGTFALLPQIVQRVKTPVIAAGGIADAKGVQAVLALGASAVMVGTAFMLCPEANTSKLHRAALASSSRDHTAITNLFSGRPARGIVNRVMQEIGPLNPLAPPFPLASVAITAIRQQAEAAGSAGFSPLWCGQNTSGCKTIGAGDLTRELFTVGWVEPKAKPIMIWQ
ncbi:MAG: nitronate monooxygenase [Phenylobacterium sp.]|jgi:nitronate monooxygenase